MHLSSVCLVLSGLLLQQTKAAPAPVPENGLEKRDLSSILSALSTLKSPTPILNQLKQVQATATPTSVEEAQAQLAAIYSATPTNIFENIAQQIADGLSTLTVVQALGFSPSGENSQANSNTRSPAKTIYPKKSSSDAPYSISETELRQAIYIPSDFTYGEKQPVIFVPGTGSYGGISFGSNLRKLLTGVSYADPVWLNVPDALLRDAQTNAEFVAYAINYISGVSNNANVSIISWSQGGLDTQWAFTYWPSTRALVSDFVPVSPDFHGTVLANAICLNPGAGLVGLGPCAPAVLQQEYNSNFVTALRAHGGADAYVPTTSVFSGLLDEIVQPQSGTGASAHINDSRGVGTTNAEVQVVCKGKGPAAGFYTHESMLVNPLTYALVVDALTHDGPGSVDRLDLDTVCSTVVAEGLGLDALLEVEGVNVLAAVNLLTYADRRLAEPALKAYATA